MKLSELILEIGDDKVEIQNLDTCAIDLNYDHKKGTTIKFGTEAKLTFEGTEKLGMVIWLDREAVRKALGK